MENDNKEGKVKWEMRTVKKEWITMQIRMGCRREKKSNSQRNVGICSGMNEERLL